MRFIIFTILLSAYLLFLASPVNAVAQLATIPGVEYEAGFQAYLGSLYTWGISIVGILALAQLVRGGIMYMVAGAVNTKEAAKGIITDALIGLGLALASYMFLSYINPTLVNPSPVEITVYICDTSETGPRIVAYKDSISKPKIQGGLGYTDTICTKDPNDTNPRTCGDGTSFIYKCVSSE